MAAEIFLTNDIRQLAINVASAYLNPLFIVIILNIATVAAAAPLTRAQTRQHYTNSLDAKGVHLKYVLQS